MLWTTHLSDFCFITITSSILYGDTRASINYKYMKFGIGSWIPRKVFGWFWLQYLFSSKWTPFLTNLLKKEIPTYYINAMLGRKI